MHLNFFDNTAQLVESLRRNGAEFPQTIAKGVIDGTVIMYEGSRQLLSDLIYNKAIPTRSRFRRLREKAGGWRSAASDQRKKGQKNFFGFLHSSRQSNKAAWRRTSTLLRNERYYIKGSGALTTGIIDNKTPYATARHNLDKPSPYGYDNRAPWRELALERFGERSLEALRRAITAKIELFNDSD